MGYGWPELLAVDLFDRYLFSGLHYEEGFLGLTEGPRFHFPVFLLKMQMSVWQAVEAKRSLCGVLERPHPHPKGPR